MKESPKGKSLINVITKHMINKWYMSGMLISLSGTKLGVMDLFSRRKYQFHYAIKSLFNIIALFVLTTSGI